MWSPFRFCNGTRTVERDHPLSNYSADEDFTDFVFLDFAGSGVVHLCGKIQFVPFYLILTMSFKGGMAAFILQLFHKLEKKVSKGSWKVPCKWLKHQKESQHQVGTQLELQASEGTGHPYVSYVSLIMTCYILKLFSLCRVHCGQ